MTDLSKTIEAKSDQLNAEDLIAGDKTIRITKVSAVAGDQPISINYEGDNGKPYKPCKSMRRVLVHVWGSDGSQYTGRSMTLFREPSIKFGGVAVGGIRISHMSHISEKKSFALTESRAVRKIYTVMPLVDAGEEFTPAPEAEIIERINMALTEEALKGAWKHYAKDIPAHDDAARARITAAKDAKKAELSAPKEKTGIEQTAEDVENYLDYAKPIEGIEEVDNSDPF